MNQVNKLKISVIIIGRILNFNYFKLRIIISHNELIHSIAQKILNLESPYLDALPLEIFSSPSLDLQEIYKPSL